jgi:hypothetical protein
MVVTDLGASALVALRHALGLPAGAALVRAGRTVAGVLVAAALLAALQHLLYPSTTPFYRSEEVSPEDRQSFVWPRHPAQAGTRLLEVAAHLLLFDFCAPPVEVEETGTPRTVVDFPSLPRVDWTPLNVVHGAAWLALLGVAAAGLRRPPREPLALALAAWLALHAALHFVFGVSLFLYSAQWAFAVAALAAVGAYRRLGASPALVAAALGLAALQAVADARLLLALLRVYGGPAGAP